MTKSVHVPVNHVAEAVKCARRARKLLAEILAYDLEESVAKLTQELEDTIVAYRAACRRVEKGRG